MAARCQRKVLKQKSRQLNFQRPGVLFYMEKSSLVQEPVWCLRGGGGGSFFVHVRQPSPRGIGGCSLSGVNALFSTGLF